MATYEELILRESEAMKRLQIEIDAAKARNDTDNANALTRELLQIQADREALQLEQSGAKQRSDAEIKAANDRLAITERSADARDAATIAAQKAIAEAQEKGADARQAAQIAAQAAIAAAGEVGAAARQSAQIAADKAIQQTELQSRADVFNIGQAVERETEFNRLVQEDPVRAVLFGRGGGGAGQRFMTVGGVQVQPLSALPGIAQYETGVEGALSKLSGTGVDIDVGGNVTGLLSPENMALQYLRGPTASRTLLNSAYGIGATGGSGVGTPMDIMLAGTPSGRRGGSSGDSGGRGGRGTRFMAEGGWVTEPTQTVLGEEEPEVVIPLSKMSRYSQTSSLPTGISPSYIEQLRTTISSLGDYSNYSRRSGRSGWETSAEEAAPPAPPTGGYAPGLSQEDILARIRAVTPRGILPTLY